MPKYQDQNTGEKHTEPNKLTQALKKKHYTYKEALHRVEDVHNSEC